MGEAIGCGVTLQQTIRGCGIGSPAAAALNAAAAPAEGPPDRCESVRQGRAAGPVDDGLTLAEHGLLVVVETIAPIPVAGIAVRL